jgi:hypothetical protein
MRSSVVQVLGDGRRAVRQILQRALQGSGGPDRAHVRLQTPGLPLNGFPIALLRAEVTVGNIDDAADKVKDATDRAAEAAKDAAKRAGDKINDAGDRMKDAGDKIKDKA